MKTCGLDVHKDKIFCAIYNGKDYTDVKDARWIACLLYKGMLRGSMIPSPVIQELRTYCRKYTELQQQKTRA